MTTPRRIGCSSRDRGWSDAHDQAETETPLRDRADARAHKGRGEAGTQSPARSFGRRHKCAAGGRRAQSAADPDLAPAYCRLAHGSSEQFIRATGYFSGRLNSSASRVPHYSGSTK